MSSQKAQDTKRPGKSKRNWRDTPAGRPFYNVVHIHLILLSSLSNFLFLILACSGLASATTYFLTVFAPDTNIDGALLNAAGQGFYTGTSGPATYCPDEIGKKCPEVQVPGGQSIYVTSSGQVEYARAHSASVPEGSFIGGWYNKTIISDCEPTRYVKDFLATDGSNIGGVRLCPDIESWMSGTGASYRLYAGTRDFNLTDCIDAVGLNLNAVSADVGCWQYI
ncbi:hypothetical protein F4781DRAFT_426282 [Annulohypoxylon bovei var. microspora]|nr:hypothetical protein F4781DRAFT_426282 [Annulohypoxylon bovei var. microspora]